MIDRRQQSSTRRPRPPPVPFQRNAPGFFEYLRDERGLRPESIEAYAYHLRDLETHLHDVGLRRLRSITPTVLTGFVLESSKRLGKGALINRCGAIRVFLRYLFREARVSRDLSGCVEGPKQYRLSRIPRSITWSEVRRVFATIDRRTAIGKRDYAILLLLVTYGLRAREVAALTLEDIDWRRDRLRIPWRKAGHTSVYPLSTTVGAALLAYLRLARPAVGERSVFLTAVAPSRALRYTAISLRASRYLQKAGIPTPRPGSHTFRHTCVQRLVDADFSLKTIGDYVGHRSPQSTEIYSKVAVEPLRAIAVGSEEEVL